MRSSLGSSALLLVSLAILAAGPAFADDAASPAAAPAQIATAQPGYAPILDVAAVLSEPAVCPAVAPDAAAPELMARPPRLRTCVCSCGAPCQTDADCGPGGRCGAGITCC
jgi:hypothetical protein